MTDFDQLFPDNRKSGETILRQAQLVMTRMFKIIDYICREHHLRYWMCSGTLLGAVRHQGFIPWDDDLDICMIREDYDRFIQIAQQELPSDLFLQTRETRLSRPSLQDTGQEKPDHLHRNREKEISDGTLHRHLSGRPLPSPTGDIAERAKAKSEDLFLPALQRIGRGTGQTALACQTSRILFQAFTPDPGKTLPAPSRQTG